MKALDNAYEPATLRVGTIAADQLTSSSTYNNWTMTYTASDSSTVTLANGADVLALLQQMRGNACLVLPDVDGQMDTTTGIAASVSLFRDWWDRRKSTYGWLDEMLSRRDYDPIENYDRKEDGGWEDEDDMAKRTTEFTPRTSDTVTETPGVTIQTTHRPQVEMTTEKTVYGDNSGTDVPLEKVVSKPDGVKTDVTEVGPMAGGSNATVTTHVGKDVTDELAHKDTHTRTYKNYRVHGNIGVSTVADMLGKEVELRRPIDLIRFALNEWLDLYTVYLD